ncbi:MAG: nucleotidyltransferase family protein [Prevotellaceae bacterium]|jgi:NDP-sugar pyrophosphorylase family protein|nr:nucleotidyltransferase family protein [Prevotellaceae bacterium]
MKCFLLAAGLGTRLKPLTDKIPKALIPVNGVPLLERNIKYLAAQGVTEFVVNVHHFADKVEDFLQKNGNFGYKISISNERNLLLETGGGLRHAAPFLNGSAPFVMYNVDILTTLSIRKMYEQHVHSGALATLAVSNRSSSRYFLFDKNNRLCGWRNVKTGEEKRVDCHAESLTPLAFGGIHIVSPKIFSNLNGFGEKFSIVDAYLALAAEHRVECYDTQGAQWIDVGKLDSLEAASKMWG